MKLERLGAIVVAVCAGGCAKTSGAGFGQVSSAFGGLWTKEDQAFVSTLSKKQEERLVLLAQKRAAQKALEEQARTRRETVPPSMYRTTEPPLPEPDLSLPVTDIPRSAATASPSPSGTPIPAGTPRPDAPSPSGSPAQDSSAQSAQ
jgi:hypothetical protein